MAYTIYVYSNWLSVHISDDTGFCDTLVFDDWAHLFQVMTWSKYVPVIYVRLGVKL